MAILRKAGTKSKSIIQNVDVKSSNVSSSVSGNLDLINSQVFNKTYDYINIKNAVRILEIFSLF